MTSQFRTDAIGVIPEQITPGKSSPTGPLAAYAASAAGLLVAIVVVHLMYVGFTLFGSLKPTAVVLDTLTLNGKQWYLPEQELPIYVAGCAAAIVVGLFVSRVRFVALQREEPGFAMHCLLAALCVSGAACGFNIAWLFAAKAMATAVPAMLAAFFAAAPAPVELMIFWYITRPATRAPGRGGLDIERDLPGLARVVRKAVDGGGLRRGAQEPAEPGCAPALTPTLSQSLASSLGEGAGTASSPNPDCKPKSLANQSQFPVQGRGHLVVDAVVVALIWLLVFVPRTDLLSGNDYLFQHFHHWDFFAMGPAIGLLKGKHLASQVYSQYGFGWPLVFAKLDRFYPLSYGHTYKIAIGWGCVYYCGFYWLLRKLLKSPAWAICGLALALRMQVFHGEATMFLLWLIPSASILRSPFDIFAILMLVYHSRSNKPIYLLAAGALAGLELVFIVDTGIYLWVILAIYCGVWLMIQNRTNRANGAPTKAGTDIASVVGAFGIALAVLLSGMYAASGRDMFEPGYLHKWLEVLFLYPSGISMLPMASEMIGLLFSYWYVLLFLGWAVWGLSLLTNQKFKAESLPVLCIAVLGSLYLIYYIGNSHLYSLEEISTPFCIVCLVTLRSAVQVFCYRTGCKVGADFVPVIANVCATISVFALVINPQFWSYPGVLTTMGGHDSATEVCYMPQFGDVCADQSWLPHPEKFLAETAELKRISDHGKTAAVIANDDTSLYVAARATLWCRYTPLLPPLMTQKMLNYVNGELERKPVDYVFLKKTDPTLDGFWAGSHPPITTDSWEKLRDTTRRLYHYQRDCGDYEIWAK